MYTRVLYSCQIATLDLAWGSKIGLAKFHAAKERLHNQREIFDTKEAGHNPVRAVITKQEPT